MFVWTASNLAAAPPPPNIVLIYADDVGYGDLGCYGATRVQTPRIDALAAQGRRFTDVHAASAVCTPSRYGLLTGRYPIRQPDLGPPVFLRSPLVIDVDRTTMADVAAAAGYQTACIGKWHLGFGHTAPTDWNQPLRPGPLDLGFGHYFGVPVVNSHPPFVYVRDDRVLGYDPADPFVADRPAETKAYDEKMGLSAIGGATAAHRLYRDDEVGTTLCRHATEFIESADQPYFLYFATTNIHHPFTPAARFVGTSEAGRYGDSLAELDWIIGEVVDAVDRAGQRDNTLILFTSDNGGMLNRGGQEAWRRGHRLNGDLLGFKFDAWEGGHRVPMIARWPGTVPPGTVCHSLISQVDLLATVADLSDQSLGPEDGPDSRSLRRALIEDGDPTIRRELLAMPQSRDHVALRHDDWLLIDAPGPGGFAGTHVGDHDLGGYAAMRLTGQTNSDADRGQRRQDAPPVQLYDLQADPGQRVNLATQQPDRVEYLRERLRRLIASPSPRKTASQQP